MKKTDLYKETFNQKLVVLSEFDLIGALGKIIARVRRRLMNLSEVNTYFCT